MSVVTFPIADPGRLAQLRAQQQGIPGELDVLVPQYLAHRRARGAADNTLQAYAADLRHFMDYAAQHDTTLAQLVGRHLVDRWLDAGILHLGWSRRTASRKLSALRSFLQWCVVERYLPADPTAEIRVRYRSKRVIAPELAPLKDVIAAIGTRDPYDLRDRAILMLLLDAALRASEITTLNIPTAADPLPAHRVDTVAMRVHVRPKGGDAYDSDVVGIEPQTGVAVQAWVGVRAKLVREGRPELFVNQRGWRLSRECLYHLVRRRGAAVGLPRLHPHLFRHRRVGEIVEKLGLDAGRAQARHRSKTTTAAVYGEHAAEVQRHAVRTLVPLGEIACTG